MGSSRSARLGKAADIGEEHAELAVLAAERERRRILGQPLDQRGRKVVVEGAADELALAVGEPQEQRHGDGEDQHDRERGQQRIEQQVLGREGGP